MCLLCARAFDIMLEKDKETIRRKKKRQSEGMRKEEGKQIEWRMLGEKRAYEICIAASIVSCSISRRYECRHERGSMQSYAST